MATWYRPVVAILLLLTLATVSASSAVEGAGSLTGSVRINGAALEEGKVLLRIAGGKDVLETPIKAGKFELLMIAAGKYEVAIQGSGVPERYSSLDASALKVELKAGSNQIELELKSK